MSQLNIASRLAAAAAMLLTATGAAWAQEKLGEELAKLAQNPIADMIRHCHINRDWCAGRMRAKIAE